MLASRIRYFFRSIPGLLASAPTTVFEVFAPFIWPSEIKHGLRIIDPQANDRKEFIATVCSALDLIHQEDPMRFRRVCREIRMIVHLPTQTGAQYSRPMRCVAIDLLKLEIAFEMDREYGIQFLACVLIHETTHGSLFSRRVIQTRRNYARIEKLCCLEMLRFAKRLRMDETTCCLFEEMGENAKPNTFLERLKFVRETIKRL